MFSCTKIHLLLVKWLCLSFESRVLTCPSKRSNLSVWLLSQHPTHTHLWVWPLLLDSCLHPTVTVTPSDLNYANRSNSLQRFGSIHTSTIVSIIRCIRTTGACAPGSRRMKLLKTVATWLDRYFAGSQGETAWKRGQISDVSVICDDVHYFLWTMLKVNWFCAICNSRGFLSHEWFVIWHFLYCYF